MTDAINTKVKALELANQHTAAPATPSDVVARAKAYHAFLEGTAAPAAGAAGAATGANKAAGATPGANSKPGGDKAAADKAAAAKVAATKAAATKAAEKAKGAATGAKPEGAAAGATGAPVPPDTKAPGGKHTYGDVIAALRQVQQKSSKDDALAILVEDGNGAKSVRDLKPALYDAVVEACENVVNTDGATADSATGGETDDPTAQEPRDELGM